MPQLLYVSRKRRDIHLRPRRRIYTGQAIPRFHLPAGFVSSIEKMAKIWQAEEGQPVAGMPVAEKPLDCCVEELGLRRLSRLASPSETVVIGGERHGLFGGPRRFVVVRLDDDETRAHSNEGWQS